MIKHIFSCESNLDFAVKHYTVNVKTGDVFSAGTDANVFINIYGELGNTGERKLAKSETHMDKFERNHVSTLYFLNLVVRV